MDNELKKLIGVKFDEEDKGEKEIWIDGKGYWKSVGVVVLTALERVSETSSSESTPSVHRKFITGSWSVHTLSLRRQLSSYYKRQEKHEKMHIFCTIFRYRFYAIRRKIKYLQFLYNYLQFNSRSLQ